MKLQRSQNPIQEKTVPAPDSTTDTEIPALPQPIPSPRSNTPRFQSGSRVGNRYRIVHMLGRGGMGEVYLAEDLKLEQTVALKFLPLTRLRNAKWRQRFLDEVKAARRINHPNVCRVYDLEEIDDQFFLSMEYIDGEDLAVLLQQVGRLSQNKAVEIGQQICQGLAAIHECGFLHRDLKPANLMIDRQGKAYLTDFSLAICHNHLEKSSIRQGTPAYMAPEQRAGHEVSTQSDLYALGLVLYKLLSGESPFIETVGDLEPNHPKLLRPRPLGALLESVHPRVEQIILQCLSWRAKDRPPSASDVAEALASDRSDQQVKTSLWWPEAELELPKRPHWKLQEKIGQGGFGEVWLAKHQKTEEKRVFKFCHDADRLRSLKREITLFRFLKQTLGHRRDIASILDWNFEQPPFFLEAKHSEEGSLQEWADRQGGLKQVPLAIRLELVAQVATALAAAHSVGVLHKDVKPGNVLITSEDGRYQAQLSDFGIGSLIDPDRLREVDITLLGWADSSTQTSIEPVGTLLYRAPELFEGKPSSLQADIYALGVLLYQVVTGDLSRALAPGWEKEVDDDLLREDIAWTVTSLPERLSDAQLLADHLRSLEARREHRVREKQQQEQAQYAIKSLETARRRRKGLALAFLVMAFFTTLMWLQSRRAEREAQSAQQIATFLENLYAGLEPGQARGDQLTVRDLLDRGTERIDQELAGQPWTQAKLYQTIGKVYHSLHLYESAIPPLEKALELRRELHKEPHLEIAESLQLLGHAVHDLPDPDRAHTLLKAALDMQHRLLPEDHLFLAKTHESIADVFAREGKPDLAEDHARLALEICIQHLDSKDARIADSQDLLAYVLHAQGRDMEAEELFELSLQARRQIFPPEHHSIAESLKNVGYMLRIRGHYLKAEPILRETLKVQRQTLGQAHPELGYSLRNLALTLIGIGDYEAAEGPLLEALALYQNSEEAEDHSALILTDLGSLYTKQRDFRKAHQSLERALSIHHGLEKKRSNIGYTLDKIAILFLTENNLDAAEVRFHEALTYRRELLGNEHPEVAFSLIKIGELNVAKGNFQEAEALFRRALEMQESGTEHKTITLRALRQLALLFQKRGDYGQAEELFREAIEERERSRKGNDLYLALELEHLTKLLLQKDELKQAEVTHHRAKAMMQSLLPEESWKLAYLNLTLGRIQFQKGQFQEAEATLRITIERLEKALGLDAPQTQEGLGLLAQIREASNS